MKPYLDYERLLRVPYVEPESGFEISPDGSLAAFSWNNSGQWEIYLLELKGGLPARQLTSGFGAKFHPRFSPDGSHLLYLLDIDGGENYDICLCNLIGGEHFNLMPDFPETIQPRLSWSPRGDRLAFISNWTGRFSTYIQHLDTTKGKLIGEAELVFDEGGPHHDVSWSHDGNYLSVIAESRQQAHAAYLIPLIKESDEVAGKAIPMEQSGVLMNVHWVDWSPSSKQLVFSGDVDGYYQIGIYDLHQRCHPLADIGKGRQNQA